MASFTPAHPRAHQEAQLNNEVMSALTDLLPRIAQRVQETEELRRIPDETIAELVDAGVFRMLQPRRMGGLETHPLEYYAVVRAIAGACGSTGWVAGVLGCHPWQVAQYPQEAQQEVWGSDPDTLVTSSYSPIGRMTKVEGGFRLSGRWSFSSGCDHAQWATLGCLLLSEDNRPRDFYTVLLPRADYTIVDVWDSVGLRGTGSNDIVVEDVFVPEHRSLRNYEMAKLRAPGRAVNTGPLYGMPFGTVFTYAVTAPVLGVVEGAQQAYLTAMRNRLRLSLGGGRFAEDQHAQVIVARASSEIDAAVLQFEHNIRQIFDCVDDGVDIPMEMRFRARRDQVRATERALFTIDSLFKTAGGASLRRGNLIERAWRDAHSGGMHVANDVERALAMYGKHAFGLEFEDTMV